MESDGQDTNVDSLPNKLETLDMSHSCSRSWETGWYFSLLWLQNQNTIQKGSDHDAYPRPPWCTVAWGNPEELSGSEILLFCPFLCLFHATRSLSGHVCFSRHVFPTLLLLPICQFSQRMAALSQVTIHGSVSGHPGQIRAWYCFPAWGVSDRTISQNTRVGRGHYWVTTESSEPPRTDLKLRIYDSEEWGFGSPFGIIANEGRVKEAEVP